MRTSFCVFNMCPSRLYMSSLAAAVCHYCSCIQRLLADDQSPRAEDVECLCKLLTTVGQQLETPQVKGRAGMSQSEVRVRLCFFTAEGWGSQTCVPPQGGGSLQWGGGGVSSSSWTCSRSMAHALKADVG